MLYGWLDISQIKTLCENDQHFTKWKVANILKIFKLN